MERASRARLSGLGLVLLIACSGGPPDELSGVPPDAGIPASTTNLHADDGVAAQLGQHLFFDARMSADGRISCASCHSATHGFSDIDQVSKGVFGRAGTRHSPGARTVAFEPFLFWDGRADSPWAQPLQAIEGSNEMDFSRAEVAHFISDKYASNYVSVFGAIPDLSAVPARARPGLPAWDSMSGDQQAAVNRIFANAGKALEAYERKLTCKDTRYDQWIAGTGTVTPEEASGAQQFVSSGCIQCHTGAAFTDGAFHNLGLSPGTSATDHGRQTGALLCEMDTFNTAGAFSDDRVAGAARIAAVEAINAVDGAFRTASLRGVGQRARFSHNGLQTDLATFIEDTYGDHGKVRAGSVGPLDPLLRRVNVGRNDADSIAAFLQTLDCPAPDPALLVP
jgi:cytochrome c peroxidase